MDDDLKQAVEFHGHLCPGLAIGYRVAKYIREHYPRSEDEELVCIAENRSCSVDAVQEILGCTAGKGNLIFKDHGKQVFTFFSRDDGRATRIYFRGICPMAWMGSESGTSKGSSPQRRKESLRE